MSVGWCNHWCVTGDVAWAWDEAGERVVQSGGRGVRWRLRGRADGSHQTYLDTQYTLPRKVCSLLLLTVSKYQIFPAGFYYCTCSILLVDLWWSHKTGRPCPSVNISTLHWFISFRIWPTVLKLNMMISDICPDTCLFYMEMHQRWASVPLGAIIVWYDWTFTSNWVYWWCDM